MHSALFAPRVPSQDIGGADIQKQELREAVELPLTHHELYRQIGIDPPRGVLLYGPPGTGKTMLAKAVAHHTTAAFIRVVGSEFVQKYLGEVRGWAETARRRSAPSLALGLRHGAFTRGLPPFKPALEPPPPRAGAAHGARRLPARQGERARHHLHRYVDKIDDVKASLRLERR